ncbi:MAG TPA: class I SAM-dependent methyltransferase [Wenzhouxiangellaceae bacterium]|nr:class I SAM-dependent methyltransferase [Wenzhouxiangellaceae bacterium]
MSTEKLLRTPEPELMDSAAQVDAYASADFSASNQWFVDQLLQRFEPRPDHGDLVDLGCGPGDICIRLACALHGWQVEGVDAGSNMLATARRAVERSELQRRIRFRMARLPDPELDRQRFDCVVSNSLLHHLPEPDTLWQSVRQVAAPGAWIQVMDLDRPESADQADALVGLHAAGEPEVLKTDFRNSLHAAWRVDEVRRQLEHAGLPLACESVSDRHWLVSGRLPE